ncbi:MAG TPA: hypothetical protein VFA81_10860 [Burkholderiales bacterium]|nr:hypothetical protein [Burkholderiales bacterium]
MSAMLKEDLDTKERTRREQLHVLGCWLALEEDSLIRAAIESHAATLQLKLAEIRWDKKYPGPKPATSSNETGYWEEKGRELRAEREGRREPYSEELGVESAWPR